MVLHIYLLYCSPDSQDVPNITPTFVPYMFLMFLYVRMTTSVTLVLCDAPSSNRIYIYQIILHIMDIVLEIVLRYSQQP